MADRQVKYWYDWDIFGPDGKLLVSLKSPPPPIDDKELSDIHYLYERIKEFPRTTLRNEDVLHRIIMLRQLALTDKKAATDLKKVGKGISWVKSKKVIESLKVLIRDNIEFFTEIYERMKTEKISAKDAIEQFLTKRYKNNYCARARMLTEKDNYRRIYSAYKKVHTKLKSAQLTDPEIFCFFEKAASHIDKPNPAIDVHPDNRLLTFVKRKTWYTMGKEMYLEVDGKVVRIPDRS